VSALQLVPFQDRAIPLVTKTPSWPTALHAVADAQAIPVSGFAVPLASALHVAPSHDTIAPPAPTALHCVLELQLTACRPFAVGLISALQLTPSHERIVPSPPTALQDVVDGQEIPLRPFVVGLTSTLHEAPSQDMIVPPAPTALHVVADGQLTPRRVFPCGRGFCHVQASVEAWALRAMPAIHSRPRQATAPQLSAIGDIQRSQRRSVIGHTS